MCPLPNSLQKKHRFVPSFVKGLDVSPWPKDVRLVLTGLGCSEVSSHVILSVLRDIRATGLIMLIYTCSMRIGETRLLGARTHGIKAV